MHYNFADQNGLLAAASFLSMYRLNSFFLFSTTALPFNSFKYLDEKNTNDFANAERARSG
jgi:hypothetical protein